ncbi:MAG: methyltransferase domain-containing protein [Patescibacteria group bacterium]
MASAFQTFFQRYLADPSKIGAIAPTSLHTARLMASFLPSDGPILEIGAGTGAITRAIVEQIHEPSRLTSVEVDPELARIFRASFPNVSLIENDAEKIMHNTHGAYSAIVSGLPFTSLPPEKTRALLNDVRESLKPDGIFIAFQYTLLKQKLFQSYFPKIDIHFSPFNLPPAFVFVCRKKSALMEEITRQ